MKVRINMPGTAASARLTAVSCATLAVLVSATVSACTSSSGPTAPDIPSPSVSSTAAQSATAKASPTLAHIGTTPPAHHTGKSSPTATPRHTGKSSPAPTHSAAPTDSAAPTHSAVTPTHTPTHGIPAGAPATGGGGTAGLQDGVLFGIGGAAIVAGLGALGFRRRLTRLR